MKIHKPKLLTAVLCLALTALLVGCNGQKNAAIDTTNNNTTPPEHSYYNPNSHTPPTNNSNKRDEKELANSPIYPEGDLSTGEFIAVTEAPMDSLGMADGYDQKGAVLKEEKFRSEVSTGTNALTSLTEPIYPGGADTLSGAVVNNKPKFKKQYNPNSSSNDIVAFEEREVQELINEQNRQKQQAMEAARKYNGNAQRLYKSYGGNYDDDYGYYRVPTNYPGGDKFAYYEDNLFKRSNSEPLSTFSVDVDKASYSFVRRSLQSNYMPPSQSVRVEEMINYFDYGYDTPMFKNKPFKPTVAVYPTPWNNNTKLLHIGIKGHEINNFIRPQANLVFLVDVSGSMRSVDKLPLLQKSLKMLVGELKGRDTVSLVVYAGRAGVVLEPTRVSNRRTILRAIDSLSAGGSTAGSAGIETAYALAQRNFEAGGVNRVILATDGDFNVGVNNPKALENIIAAKRKTGIYLSVLGFGQGNYNDHIMQSLAQAGNGNAAYIDSLKEAKKVLVDEASSTLFTIAKDVKIQVEFNPAMVYSYRLIGYESRMLNKEDFNNDKVDAGDIGAGHTVTAIYEIVPAVAKRPVVDPLRYGANDAPQEYIASQPTGEYAFLKIRYKLPHENRSRLISKAIDSTVEYKSIFNAPRNIRFASSVAAFGQMLKGNKYILENFSNEEVLRLAESGKGRDKRGLRTEFIKLVRIADQLKTGIVYDDLSYLR